MIGGFKIYCRSKDWFYGVTVKAKLKITRKGAHGVGEITATCAGAVDTAGYKSKPVSVSYAVVYGFGGFTAPKPGVAISLKAHRFTSTFRLATGSGSAISDSLAAGLAKAGEVKVTLTGPGIAATSARCRLEDGWAPVQLRGADPGRDQGRNDRLRSDRDGKARSARIHHRARGGRRQQPAASQVQVKP